MRDKSVPLRLRHKKPEAAPILSFAAWHATVQAGLHREQPPRDRDKRVRIERIRVDQQGARDTQDVRHGLWYCWTNSPTVYESNELDLASSHFGPPWVSFARHDASEVLSSH
jgi:hypothetical protein